MRILLTTDVAGGVWSYTEELTDALRERGHEVVLVSLGGEPGEGHRAWLDERAELDFTALDAPLEWMPEPEPGLADSARALRRVAERTRPDVIHLNQFYYGAFDLGAPALVVAHSDVVSWWERVKGEGPPDDAWFRRYREWVEAGLRAAAARAAPSAWMAAETERIYGAHPVRVVHNARAPERFSTEGGPRARRLVTVARLWDEAKGARDLLPAAARVRAAVPGAEVAVAGAVRHPGGGESFPTDAPGVRWVGSLPPGQLRAFLGGSAVYAATSRYEPFGLAPLEAALAGCALVMTDIPTFRELWDGCALFYPPGDSAALAEAAAELLADPARLGELARRAGERARERYRPERMAREYEALYAELLRPRSALRLASAERDQLTAALRRKRPS